LAQDLADSRGWLEDRAHSLRQSQVVANVYQKLLLNGAERLSAYYKGGVRPKRSPIWCRPQLRWV